MNADMKIKGVKVTVIAVTVYGKGYFAIFGREDMSEEDTVQLRH